MATSGRFRNRRWLVGASGSATLTSFPDQFQKVTAQLLADTEYRAKLGKAGDVFIEGRTTDVMMQLI